MSVCKYCKTIGGYHSFGCPAPRAARESRGFEMLRPAPRPTNTPTHRVERCAGLTVYVPIRPVKP